MKRIQSAVAQLREPGFEPFISITNTENDSELPDSQGTASTPASQDSAIFKKPEVPPKKKRQNKGSEIAGLKAQVDILLKQQTSNASSRNESVLRQELAVLQQELKRQRESSGNESMLQQEIDRRRQETIQREDQLREESKHQLAREKEESKQQLAREKEESKQRHAELMDLLKEQKEKTRSS